MASESLEDLEKMWDIDCIITRDKLSLANLQTPMLHSKYYKFYTREKIRLCRLQEEYNRLQYYRKMYYLGKLSADDLKEWGWEPYLLKKPLKNEIDELIRKDSLLSNKRKLIEYSKAKISFLEDVIYMIKQRNWYINNEIKLIELDMI